MDAQKAQLIGSFLNDCRVRNFSEKSILAYKSHLRYFLSLYPLNASREDLAKFLINIRDEKQLSPSTVENYFITLSTFYEFMKWEGIVKDNPIMAFRKRYLRYYKTPIPEERQLISITQMKNLILYPDDIMWRTIFCMYAKTGMRRQELIDLDVEDLNQREGKIYLKKHPKRSNRVMFIDDELHFFLAQWMKKRSNNGWNDKPWLFRSEQGKRIYGDLVYDTAVSFAKVLGFHNPTGRLDEKFGVHCFRHFFTTSMLRAGCPKEYVQEFRGDIRMETIDLYHHISLNELKEAYLKYIFRIEVI